MHPSIQFLYIHDYRVVTGKIIKKERKKKKINRKFDTVLRSTVYTPHITAVLCMAIQFAVIECVMCLVFMQWINDKKVD